MLMHAHVKTDLIDSESIQATVRRNKVRSVRGFRGTFGRGAPAKEGDVWVAGREQELLLWRGEGLGRAPRGIS